MSFAHLWLRSSSIPRDVDRARFATRRPAVAGSSTEAAVLADLDSKIPREFSGRIWLFHSARPTHWDYTGLDEGEAWQRYFWNRNCRPGPYIRFPNLGISPVICSGNSR